MESHSLKMRSYINRTTNPKRIRYGRGVIRTFQLLETIGITNFLPKSHKNKRTKKIPNTHLGYSEFLFTENISPM